MFDRGGLIILVCVLIMTTGQVLFKIVALNYNKVGSIMNWGVLGIFLLAGSLYVISSGLWVWALRSVDISRAYPLFAFGFVLVPLMGVLIFDEILGFKYALGIFFIIIGIILIGSSS